MTGEQREVDQRQHVVDAGVVLGDAEGPAVSGLGPPRRTGGRAPWDPFSGYRAGFEIRTYRLCRRILMFHHFPDEPGVGADCLGGSLDLAYTSSPAGSFLASLTRHGLLGAVDYELGVLKTGKEADVHLVERSVPGTDIGTLMATKRYRGSEHRMFHRDSGYVEGRRVRRSRETRAMANRTTSAGRSWPASGPPPSSRCSA